MTRYTGNQTVGPGIYFNARTLSFKSIDEEGRLPGPETETWRDVPVIFMLIAAPVIGGAFALFLPLIGFVLLGALMAKWAAHVLAITLNGLSRILRPAWQPALAFLSRGRRGRKKETPTDEESEEWAEEVRKELDEDR
ncbi:MAG: hypothetical protein R3338_09670 [Thermoanaerobaculia bacterium]|nr:hypothetical protein [Thermoanaerobaculia bacterium]